MDFVTQSLRWQKFCIPILALITMMACGPSQDERERIAAVTCAEIAETRNFESARRVRLVNEAREKFGAAPMLRGDEAIKAAYSYGLCKELVLSDKRFEAALERILADIAREKNLGAEERRTKAFARRLLVDEAKSKWVAWFNSNYSIVLQNIYVAERPHAVFTLGDFTHETPAEYGILGELVVNCATEAHCDQLRAISATIDLTFSAGDESVTFRVQDYRDNELVGATFRQVCLGDNAGVQESETEAKALLTASIVKQAGFLFDEIDTDRCKYRPPEKFKRFYKVKDGDMTAVLFLGASFPTEGVDSELPGPSQGASSFAWHTLNIRNPKETVLRVSFGKGEIPFSIAWPD